MSFPMPADFLHRHKDFKALLAIVSEERGILPGLVEKDYWIKHILHSMTKLELEFELKLIWHQCQGVDVIPIF